MNRKIISKVLLTAMSVSMLSFGAINSNTSAQATLSATNAPGINASTGTTEATGTTETTGATVNASTTAAPTDSPTNVVPTQTPEPGNIWFDEARRKTSGKYTYHILSEEKRLITILGVKDLKEKIAFPKILDGYKVIGLGVTETLPIDNSLKEAGIVQSIEEIKKGVFEKDIKKVKRIILPKTLRYIGVLAFEGCNNLENIDFRATTKKVFCMKEAFYGCSSLKHTVLPKNVVLCKGVFKDCGKIKTIKIKTEHIKEAIELFARTRVSWLSFENKLKNYCLSKYSGGVIEKMIIPHEAKSMRFIDDYDDYEGYYEPKGSIKKLVVKGDKTIIKGWDPKYQSIGRLYTIKGAKAIKWAKKNKIKYKVVSKAKIKKMCKG